MRNLAIFRRRWPLALLAAGVVAVSGCDKNVFGTYVGRDPQKADLVAERVIVRTVVRAPAGSQQGKVNLVHLDRLKYIEARQAHDVNRLVALLQENGGLTLDSLGLQVGDTIAVTTRYRGVILSGPAPGTVPSWAGNDYLEYPIAGHLLLALDR